jgi:hypothetical protein
MSHVGIRHRLARGSVLISLAQIISAGAGPSLAGVPARHRQNRNLSALPGRLAALFCCTLRINVPILHFQISINFLCDLGLTGLLSLGLEGDLSGAFHDKKRSVRCTDHDNIDDIFSGRSRCRKVREWRL